MGFPETTLRECPQKVSEVIVGVYGSMEIMVPETVYIGFTVPTIRTWDLDDVPTRNETLGEF